MVYRVKVFKPDKDGNLVLEKILDAEDVSNIHWTKFNRDSKYQTDFQGNTTPTYHRLGADPKECAEEGCTNMVEDSRTLTCSKKCKLNRLRRKNREPRARQRAKQNKKE